ncbi:CHAT domain-containing protein [Nocardia gipuzkoensis]
MGRESDVRARRRAAARDAVDRRLERIDSTGDFSLALSSESDYEIEQLGLPDCDAEEAVASQFLLGWLQWYRYLARPDGPNPMSWQDAVELFTACFVAGAGAESMPGELLPSLVLRAGQVGSVLLHESQNSRDDDVVFHTVDLWRRLHDLASTDDLLPADHPLRVGAVNSLGVALRIAAQRQPESVDLEEAIDLGRKALAATASDDPSRTGRQYNVAAALRARYSRSHSLSDLDEAVALIRSAIEVSPVDQPRHEATYTGLATTLLDRFRATGARADLDEAVECGRLAVTAVAEVDDYAVSGVVLANLATSLRTRFEVTHSARDIDEAVDISRRAVEAAPVGHSSHREVLANLLVTLRHRADNHGGRADLDEAADVCGRSARTVLPDDPDGHAIQALWALALRMLFEHTDAQADLDRAIDATRIASTATPTGHPERAERLAGLAHLLRIRLERTGEHTDFEEIGRVIGESESTLTSGHTPHTTALTSYALACFARFEGRGDAADLDAAADLGERAVATTAAEADSSALEAKSALSRILQARFENFGAVSDLNESIRLARDVVLATPIDAPDFVRSVANLVGVLRLRFERTGDVADLLEAIEVGRHTAARSTGDGPDRGSLLLSLASAMQTWSGHTSEQSDLDSAVEVGRQALSAMPTGSRGHTFALSNLGAMLLARFQRSGNRADLDEALELTEDALTSAGVSAPQRNILRYNQGVLLYARFGRTGAQPDAERAIAVLSAVAGSTAAAHLRIRAARVAAELLEHSQPGRAAELLRTAVRLLPELASRRLDLRDQQHALRNWSGMVSWAVALTLADSTAPAGETATLALQMSEAGRMVVLSEILHARSELTDLADRHPALAEDFIRIRDLLDLADAEHSPHSRTGLLREFEKVRHRIRQQDGFASFGLPPAIDDLVAEAVHGPVVAFNISALRSDALLLTAEGVVSLPLPGLGFKTVVEQIGVFNSALISAHEGSSGVERRDAQQQVKRVLEWLWDNAAEPVLDALGYRSEPTADHEWPRVWWSSGGLMSLLPIHAAGYHDGSRDPAARTVLDRVVSSFTPTVSALRHARARSRGAAAGRTQRALTVAMPTTPYLPAGSLDHVRDEAALLVARLPGSVAIMEPEPVSIQKASDPAAEAPSSKWVDELPTKANVLALLPEFEIVHFACHGVTEASDPARSRLLLHDHARNPFTVESLTALRLDRAELAFLSACDTAVNTDAGLIDEAIHLTSAFQLGGYPHVIGTLWSIDDATTVDIAEMFYDELISGGATKRLDCGRAAAALHRAVRTMRDHRINTPTLWAGYIHAGA